MYIAFFSIRNFRSIVNADVPLSNYGILIGPNNQGKSNILKALVMGLHHVRVLPSGHPHYSRRYSPVTRTIRPSKLYNEFGYQYERDYPLNLQPEDREKKGKTTLGISFALTDTEKKSFQAKTNHSLKGDLVVEVILGSDSIHRSIKDSKNKKRNLNKSDQIFEFLTNHIQITYIEAIRDSDRTIDMVDNMIADEFAILSTKSQYKNLMKKLEKLQKPILESLSEGLTESVSGFLPDVKKISLDSQERIKRIIRTTTSILVDDGTSTYLEFKGDGIKSLIAISLLQHASRKSARKRKIILAVEEPESHLHPDAIHKLREALEEISSEDQVIISTHSPLLVNKVNVSRNIIVNEAKAVAAASISDIRRTLGVRMADNLVSANLIVLTEGNNDSSKLKSWLRDLSPKLKKAIDNGIIAFDPLGGSSNLSHKASLWEGQLCNVYSVLDSDKEGRNAFIQARKTASASMKNVVFLTLNGYPESEMEDLILPGVYKNELKEFGVDLDKSREFKKKNGKWSDRMKSVFKTQGRHWDDQIKGEIKAIITTNSVKLGIASVHPKNRGPIKKIAHDLETYLEGVNG